MDGIRTGGNADKGLMQIGYYLDETAQLDKLRTLGALSAAASTDWVGTWVGVEGIPLSSTACS
jgi:hypothetical protein